MASALRFAGVVWIVIGVIIALVNIVAFFSTRGINFAGFLTLLIGPLGAIFSGILSLGVGRGIEMLEEVRYAQREIQRKLNG